MTHTANHYEYLVGSIPGFSEKQLRSHFELYQGYVKKWNQIEEKLKTADPKTADYSYGEISELLRRRSVAYNGTYLHELFFENLSGIETKPSQALKGAIERTFGSMKRWFDELSAGLVSEQGWVLLTRSREDGVLRNNLLEQHHVGAFVQQDIVLAFDGWEHAYFVDYANRKADYVSVLEKSINWDVASKRFESSERLSRAAAPKAA